MTSPACDVWQPTPARFGRRFERSRPVASTREWRALADDLLSWRIKTRSGFAVDALSRAREGQRLTITVRVFGVTVREPVEVIEVIDTDDLVALRYRTLPGHPVSGEESFILHRHGDHPVLTIRSLTRPGGGAMWRLAYPILRVAQVVVRRRYLRSLG